VIQHVTVSAGYGDSNSKLNLKPDGTAALKLTWTEDDAIDVFEDGKDEAVGHLVIGKISDGGLTAEFSGEIVSTVGKKLTFRVGNKPSSFESQAGTLDHIRNNMLCVEGTATCNKEGNYDKIAMGLPYALLKLDLSGLWQQGPVKGENKKDPAVTICKGDMDHPIAAIYVSPTKSVVNPLKEVYVAIPVEGTPAKTDYIFVSGADNTKGLSFTKKTAWMTWTLQPNMFYTQSDGQGGSNGNAIVVPVFTVSDGARGEQSTTISFAPGNLRYLNDNFEFEANQWTYRSSYSTTDCGHFFWSSSSATAVASSYNDPIATETDKFFTNQADFAVDGRTGWRTLSNAECDYLLNISGASSGARTDANRFAKAMVNGVKGLLVFPDGYNGGEAISTTVGVAEMNNKDVDFPTESIPNDTWASMESAGVVFLPAAGYRTWEDVNESEAETRAFYWSSTPSGTSQAWYRFFNFHNAGAAGDNRSYGFSVRLVR
ncbi:MAG: hypothetical protein Q4E55_09800, partial [Bacteroidales bacterium]|nr:hypothetical protein [Bacteroidales bacterium]